ncbi:thioredoxin domain-containing protein [Caproiciproducens sp. R1]|uniref:thioredoxin domain-containing protein n=1 Tax=Caproiciproducens sp. R1 TaxID=3435000 RepID=UPI00403364D6
MSDTENRVPNRLIHEKSPYLLQHAYNPVNWYPWGKDAFEKAKAQDKPVFLSIGYSTCHWCHVMERESFEDDEVAQELNRNFIAIKVDKEERPDVDAVYMTVCQALTGSGGWPLTILMTPDQRPFYAGTYFPKHSRYSMPGLMDLLASAAQQWRENRKELLGSGERIAMALRGQTVKKEGRLTKDLLVSARSWFRQTFDRQYGGFGASPKFPSPHNLLFLLQYAMLEKEGDTLQMAEKTLRQMYRGGIFDHVGFGFSRYSTDDKWLVPHFEKMLYDNALLAIAYLEAFRITQNDFYKTVAVKTMEYILREMTDENGGFYCAQDADSDGQEGKYYVFTPDEIVSLLGESDGRTFIEYFGMTPGGNFEGKNILNLIGNPDAEHPNEAIERLLPKVYEYRLTRTKLHKDDKILTSWNALMITAFADAYRILEDNRYLDAAGKAMCFLQSSLTDEQGGLRVRYRDGEAAGTGGLDDYAFTVWALLSLYDATYDVDYLQQAAELNRTMLDRFYDGENGGFYLSASDAEALIYRPKETYDGAIPSGNSAASLCLVKLAALTGNPALQEAADQQLRFMAGAAQEFPAGHSFALTAMTSALYPSREIVCVVKDGADFERVKSLLHKKSMPNTTVLVKSAENAEQLAKLAEFTAEYPLGEGRSAYYICQNNACSPPIYDLKELDQKLSQ